MAKRKSRHRRKRSRKFSWLIAGITAATTFDMEVYMLILAIHGSNLAKSDEEVLECVGKIIPIICITMRIRNIHHFA